MLASNSIAPRLYMIFRFKCILIDEDNESIQTLAEV